MMCVNIGHCNECVIRAIAHQAQEPTCTASQMATAPRAILGRMLTVFC